MLGGLEVISFYSDSINPSRLANYLNPASIKCLQK
jgi:hypothetical protein